MKNWRISPLVCSATFLFFLAYGNPVYGKTDKSKTIKKEYPANANTQLSVDHRYGILNIMEYGGNQIQVELVISVSGDDPDDVETFLEQIEIEDRVSGDFVNVETYAKINSWNTNNRYTKIKFKNGVVCRNLTKISMDMTVQIPRIRHLQVSNKYEDINISPIQAALSANLYSGTLRCDEMQGSLDLDLKYGKAFLGNCNELDLDLYDSKLTLAQGTITTIESKYSEVEMGDLASLALNAYDDEYEIGNVAGDIEVQDKYSEIEIKSCGQADVDIYDGELDIEQAQDLTIASKYTDFVLGQTGAITLKSHDDNFRLGTVVAMDIDELKYSEIYIDQLNESIVAESYDSKIIVDQIGDAFHLVDIDCKYDDVKIPLQQKPTELEVEAKYGKFEFDETRYAISHQIEKNSEFRMNGKSEGVGSLVKVKIIAYDSNIDLE